MQRSKLYLAIAASLTLSLGACSGDDGDNGTNGTNGSNGSNGAASIVNQTDLPKGDSNCFAGGIKIESGTTEAITATSYICNPTQLDSQHNFNRVATFPVCLQLDDSCDTDTETVAEIVAASKDGMTLIYTDSPQNALGFVDITNPTMPQAAGTLALSGEPTSVAVKDGYALVAVNTSTDYINVSGELVVVEIATQSIVRTIALSGQPDSIAVSPDGNFAAIVIENERDEDLGDGAPPQAPAGGYYIVNTNGAVADWLATEGNFTDVPDLYTGDPEPEFVDINSNNIAVFTMQENNHIALVDLATNTLVNDFSAGDVDLERIDLEDERPNQVMQNQSLDNVLREPDGVSWVSNDYFATANEGDLDGGSRGFSIFNTAGDVVWDSAEMLDHLTARFGQYPDKRSDAKGSEPENAELGIFGNNRYLFVNSERASMVFVFDLADPRNPVYKQALPAAAGPEGVVAIPQRNLVIAASEEDNRGDKLRGALNIYQYQYAPAQYPTLVSADRENGSPIPWAAMSGLAADPMNSNRLYAVEDSFFNGTRIFTINVGQTPALLTNEMRIKDSNDIFASVATTILADASVDDDDATRLEVFDNADLAAMINDDKTVNIDGEGVAVASDGGFWVASEGAGTIGDDGRPVNSLNFIFKTDNYGVIEDVIQLPDDVNAKQIRFGFEGVAEYNGSLYVAFQRAWKDETNPRIGIYNIAAKTWIFVYYPLEAVASQAGGWVGLSDISSIANGEFLIVERDNQFGPDAAIKRLYKIDLSAAVDGNTIVKTLVRDVTADLANFGGLTPEKIEGSAVTANGDVYIINDNDGVDDNSGETLLINLGNIL